MVTRQDINPGDQCAQTVHSISDFAYEFPQEHRFWKETSNTVVCLGIQSEFHLLTLFDKLSPLTQCVKFFEPDDDVGWTSLCFYSTPETKKLTSKLPLLLKTKTTK